MIRSLLILLAVGLVGLAVIGVVFSMLVPLLMLALKVGLVLVVGYLVLRLIRPDLAEECKRKLEGRG
jgi:fatty acid desaturase